MKLITLVLFAVTNAFACDCEYGLENARRWLRDADVAFVGRSVTQSRLGGWMDGMQMMTTTFHVTEGFKNIKRGERFRLLSPPEQSSCGIVWRRNEGPHLIFGYRGPGGVLHTTNCAVHETRYRDVQTFVRELRRHRH